MIDLFHDWLLSQQIRHAIRANNTAKAQRIIEKKQRRGISLSLLDSYLIGSLELEEQLITFKQ